MGKEAELEPVTFTILFKDGSEQSIDVAGDFQHWPVAVLYRGRDIAGNYPIWDGNSHNNLYGRLMTLMDAVIEGSERNRAVKNLVSKELQEFSAKMFKKTERRNGMNAMAHEPDEI